MENQNRALLMGARDTYGKPFEQTETLNRIYSILETKMLSNQLHEDKNNLEIKVGAGTKE